MVPKDSRLGDQLIIKIGNSFFAVAQIVSKRTWPRKDRPGRYNASIQHVRLLNPPIPIFLVKRHVPEWKWTTYPRSIATPPVKIAKKLRTLINTRRSLRQAEALRAPPHELSDAELKDLAYQCAKKHVDPKIRRVPVRERSRWIHRWVLRRASGMCEGCNDKAPFRRLDGSPYLEPHHTLHLARDNGPDHPRTVIALCPTCHKRVHHSEDRDIYNNRLKTKLKKIERKSQ
jgi:5-methylcytosine-specific restriction protein A